MHQELIEMASMLRPAFLINAIHAPDGRLAAFVAGDWEKAWLAGCQAIKAIYGVPLAEQADIVIASAGGAPKDINLYQGTKAMDNAVLAVKENGVVILTLACQDIGEPSDFSRWFEHGAEWRERQLRENFTVPGFVALKCGLDLQRIPHILVTLPQNKEFVERAGFIYAEDLGQAFAAATQMVGRPDCRVIIMPDAANTVPQLATKNNISRK
jgi:nickel-dependent lactate racemase